MERLKQGDQVVVLTGKDRGKQGEILSRIEKDGKVVLVHPSQKVQNGLDIA